MVPKFCSRAWTTHSKNRRMAFTLGIASSSGETILTRNTARRPNKLPNSF